MRSGGGKRLPLRSLWSLGGDREWSGMGGAGAVLSCRPALPRCVGGSNAGGGNPSCRVCRQDVRGTGLPCF